MQPGNTVDLTNCDREPIHIPGSIQAHGCLLACDVNLETVQRHSLNAAEVVGAHGSLLGRRLDAVLGQRAVHDLRNALAVTSDAARPGLKLSLMASNGRTFDAAVHTYKGAAIVELEPAASEGDNPLGLARTVVARLRQITDVDGLLKSTPRLLRAVLGYDRVMIYRFEHDGAGQVVAEAKSGQLESFLGQHFPASDIPRQARELYLKNTIRIISDAGGARVPIEPVLDTAGAPLDLSFAHLRSVSPIHCEYLRNMGVGASMSISITTGDALWGLIACHHYAPRTLTMTERIAAEMFGDFFSLHLHAALQKQRLDATMRTRRALDGILREMSHQSDVEAFLRESVATFATLMPCDGIGVWLNGAWSAHGSVPPTQEIAALARAVASISDAKVWATHELSATFAGADAYQASACGLLAVPLSQVPRDFLFFFRKELVQTVEWAGNPDKTYEAGPLGDRLTPRRSFAIWKETVERQSRPWTTEEHEIGEAIRTTLLEVIMRQTEILSTERRKADIRQKMLNEELNHRVKNILALIKSVVSQPTEGRTLQEYVAALKGRIMALALAHDQIVRSDGGGSLRELLEAELNPHRPRPDAVVLEGPELDLDARAYSVMALVIHEMATNAAKYGSLSVRGGRLDVRWIYDAEHGCILRWIESGGPPVAAPQRRGFGSVLIDRSIPFDLGGESELRFEASGMAARFIIPAKFAIPVHEMPAAVAATDPHASNGLARLTGLDLLIVEDQLVIAMDVESMLSDLGAASTETAATAAEAMRILARKRPHAAVLDVNLGAGTSMPIALELRKQGVPFVFATGYGESGIIPQSLSEVPVVRKPYTAESLARALTTALGRNGR